jgi:ABC-type polysaccharide/polyol phosphate transport system ATPase subunit
MLFEPVIELTNVWKKYSRHQVLNNSLREELTSIFTSSRRNEDLHSGEFWALRGVTFNIQRGECVGLYGPNGSGKSTIFKLISNVTYPTIGNVSVSGKVAPLIELGAGMHPDLTGTENIYMNGTILGLTIKDIKQRLPEIVEFSGLQDFIDVSVKKYSSGMYLRLAFSIAVHSTAEAFLFDEVLSVGDEEFQAKCRSKILQLSSEGKTIAIVSHDIEGLKQLCHRIVYVSQGSLVPA